MISYWHLAATCCIPQPNPPARLRELEVLRQAAQELAKHTPPGSKHRTRPRGRWEALPNETVQQPVAGAK